jgi:methionyl-tRNA synthetase
LIYFNTENLIPKNSLFKKKNTTINQNIEWNVFPKLKIESFYDQIIIKNGKPYISDNFIANVVEKVIKETKISHSNIRWGYRFKNANRTEINFYFETTIYFNKKLRKKYNFKILEYK